MRYLLIVLVSCTGCTHGLTVGYRTVGQVGRAGNAAGKALASYCKAKRLACDAKPEAERAKCRTESKCKVILGTWVNVVKPALGSALDAAWAALETAYLAGKDKSDWLKLLRPGICAALRIVPKWKAYLGKAFDKLEAVLKIGEQFVCGVVP